MRTQVQERTRVQEKTVLGCGARSDGAPGGGWRPVLGAGGPPPPGHPAGIARSASLKPHQLHPAPNSNKWSLYPLSSSPSLLPPPLRTL